MITQLVWDLDINLYHELECPDRALNGEEPAQTIPRRIKLRRSKIVHWRENNISFPPKKSSGRYIL